MSLLNNFLKKYAGPPTEKEKEPIAEGGYCANCGYEVGLNPLGSHVFCPKCGLTNKQP